MESRFNGTVLDYFIYSLGAGLLISITLGIATPWAVCIWMRWICKNSTLNGKQLSFKGSGGGLFGHFIKWFILTIITFGIYSFWAGRNMIRWIIENTETVG